MWLPTSVDDSRLIDEHEETEMSTDLVLKSEMDYRTSRIKEVMRHSRKVNRVRRPRKPAAQVA